MKTKFNKYQNLSKSEKGDISLNLIIFISVLITIGGTFMACLKIDIPWFELNTFGIRMTILGTISAVVFGVIRGTKNIDF